MINSFKKLVILFLVTLIANSYALPNAISSAEAAAFALSVYHDEKNTPPIPDDFILLCKCPLEMQNKNYYGEAYYRIDYAYYSDGRKTPSGVTVVLTHRGTILNQDNLEDDVRIALKIAPDTYFTGSKRFTDYVTSLVYAKFPYSDGFFVHHFVHVGHSLGAIHAELNYFYQRKRELSDNEIYATTFESPGSKEIVLGLISIGELHPNSLFWTGNLTIINSDINLINTTNEQANRVWTVNAGYDFINISQINLSPLDIKYFSTLYTLDQHSMVKIYNYLKNGGKLTGFTIYPSGIAQAFKYYKTYSPDWENEHHKYWDKALKIYWDNHKEIHSDYNNDFSNYQTYTIKHHLYYI